MGSCSGAEPVSWFDDASNWGTAAGKIGPGSTVGVCGVLSSPLVFHGSGVTVSFQQGAGVSVPVCPFTGCIDTNGFTGITILGGTVQATANGTGLANHVASSYGIEAAGCDGCVINGTTVADIYTRTSDSDLALDSASEVRGIDISGSGWTVEDATIHDAGWGIVDVFQQGATGDTVTGSDIYNVDHGWVPTFDGAGGYGSFSFTDNHVHDFANWDSGSADAYHHDGIHCFTFGSNGQPAHFDSMTISGNTFDGDPGQNSTADIFIEGGSSSGSTPCGDSSSVVRITENAFSASEPLSNGFLGIFSTSPQVIDNTFKGSGQGINVDISSGASNVTFMGNTDTDAGTLIWISPSELAPGGLANNTYSGSGSNAFACGSSIVASIASWQACIGGDLNATFTAL